MANKLGADNDILAVAPGQEFRLDLAARLLQKVGDPDGDFFLQLKEGVSLGVDKEMARTPAVFEEKIKWKLNEVDGAGIGDRETTSRRRATWNKSKNYLEKNRSSAGWLSWTRPMRGRSTVTACSSRPSRWSRSPGRYG